MSSSSNRFDILSHAENASREQSPVESDADYPIVPQGSEPEISWSPTASPGPAETNSADPAPAGPAETDPADLAPAGPGHMDLVMPDAGVETATVGPSSAVTTTAMSMQDLGENLPVVRNKRGFWDAFHQKGRSAVEAVQAGKSKKVREAQPSTSVGTKIPSAAQDLQPVQRTFFDPRSIRNLRWTRCALMYSVPSQAMMPIGNAFAFEENGCNVVLGIDAGRYGPSHLTLRFRIKKRNENAASKDSKWHEFDATWRQGLVIDNAAMMEDITIQAVDPNNTFGPGEGFRSVPVEAKCPKGRDNDLSKLMVINFNSNSVRLDQVDDQVFHGLEPEVRQALQLLFGSQGPFQMTIWFVGFPNPAAALLHWGNHFIESVKYPPFWPYYCQDQKTLNCTLEQTPDIRSFCNGLLCTYPPLRSRTGGFVMDEDGHPVDDFTRPAKYYNFPRQLNWDQEEDLGIFASMPIIREVQFGQGQVAHLRTAAHGVFLLKVAMLKLPAQTSKEVRELTNAFYAFVRMSPNRNALQESTPSEGMRIRLEWDNSDVSKQKPHVPSNKRQNQWFGTVISREAECRATCTQFCVWLNKPMGSTSNPHYFKELRNVASTSLPHAWMMVEVDTMAAEREIKAAKLLADKTFNPERLGEVRVALMQEPSRMVHSHIDLTTLPNINTAAWVAWKEFKRSKYVDNPRQFEVLEELEHVDNRITGIVGPPGAGKTEVLTDSMNGAVLMGHKVLVTAVSNKAVDNAANKMWQSFPAGYRDKYKFLRLETNSTENYALLTREDVKKSAADMNARAEYKGPTNVEEDDALTEVFSKAAADYAENQVKLAKLYERFQNIAVALAELGKVNAKKQSGVPARMTLANRIFELQVEDDLKAQGAYAAELAAYRTDAATEEEVRVAAEEGAPNDLLEAMRSEKLAEEEIQTRVQDGRIRSVAKRNLSSGYSQIVNDYLAKGGQLSKKKRQSFKELRTTMVARVLKETHVLFTTCNNSGSETVKDVYNPTLIAIDEAGQLTMGAFAIVATSYTTWEAIILFGDPKQLLPFLSSGRANEFRLNAELSVLGLLEVKNGRVIFLNLQYRMAPSIADWPARYFYSGLLNNHQSTLADTNIRRMGRQISKDSYKILGPEGNGSETWFVDVMNGVSRVQENGTSLLNYANADAVAVFVDELMRKGVSADKIVILTYYAGQKSVLTARIEEFARVKGRAWAGTSFEISTVDAYQGQESEIVIADFVATNSGGVTKGFSDSADDEVSGDEADPNAKEQVAVSAFVKNAHRLCCLCTRARSVFVVFGQLTALIATGRSTQRQPQAAVSRMVMDYRERKLVHYDSKHLDTSPRGIAERASWDTAKLANELRVREAQRLTYLNTRVSKLEKSKVLQEHDDTPPRIWRTHYRRTKRPINIGKVSEAADRHDVANAQDAGARLTLRDPNATQRQKKEERKAKSAADKKAAEEEAEKSGTGKGKVIFGPPPAGHKGKGKEVEREDAGTTEG